SCKTLRTPRWAKPRTPPPPNAQAILGRGRKTVIKPTPFMLVYHSLTPLKKGDCFINRRPQRPVLPSRPGLVGIAPVVSHMSLPLFAPPVPPPFLLPNPA